MSQEEEEEEGGEKTCFEFCFVFLSGYFVIVNVMDLAISFVNPPSLLIIHSFIHHQSYINNQSIITH